MFKKLLFDGCSLNPILQMWGMDGAVFRLLFCVYFTYFLKTLQRIFPTNATKFLSKICCFLKFLSAFDSFNIHKLSPILSENFILLEAATRGIL